MTMGMAIIGGAIALIVFIVLAVVLLGGRKNGGEQ